MHLFEVPHHGTPEFLPTDHSAFNGGFCHDAAVPLVEGVILGKFLQAREGLPRLLGSAVSLACRILKGFAKFCKASISETLLFTLEEGPEALFGVEVGLDFDQGLKSSADKGANGVVYLFDG